MSNKNLKRFQMHYNIVKVEQRSQEWRDFRRDKIGASMIASIMGIDPYRTKLQLWEEIVLETSRPVNPAMQRGIDKEKEALLWLNLHTGSDFTPAVLQSVEHSWMIASLDGFRGNTPQILEIKWINQETHKTALEGKIPSHYMPQVQFQMYVADAGSAIYLSCYKEEKVQVRIERDDTYIEKMLSAVMAFRDSLIDFKPPEASEKDVIAIVDPIRIEKAQRRVELHRLIKELTTEMDEIDDFLISEAEHQRLTIGDLKMTKFFKKGNIDYKAIPQLKDVDLERYRKEPTIQWKFTCFD